MTSLNFAVSFKAKTIVDVNKNRIDQISLKDGFVIGYISIIDRDGDTTVTPFTAAGTLEEAHCASCAAKTLFANYSGLNKSLVDIASDAGSVSANISEKILMAAIIGSLKEAKETH